MSRSLKLFLYNIGVLAALALLILSPLGKTPGAMHIVIIVPFFLFIVSFIPAFGGIVYGLLELQTPNHGRKTWIGLLGNAGYLFAYTAMLVFGWPAQMSV